MTWSQTDDDRNLVHQQRGTFLGVPRNVPRVGSGFNQARPPTQVRLLHRP